MNHGLMQEDNKKECVHAFYSLYRYVQATSTSSFMDVMFSVYFKNFTSMNSTLTIGLRSHLTLGHASWDDESREKDVLHGCIVLSFYTCFLI